MFIHLKRVFFIDALKIISMKLIETEIQNFNKEWINRYLKEFANEHEISYPTLMKALRFVLSGLKVKIKYSNYIFSL